MIVLSWIHGVQWGEIGFEALCNTASSICASKLTSRHCCHEAHIFYAETWEHCNGCVAGITFDGFLSRSRPIDGVPMVFVFYGMVQTVVRHRVAIEFTDILAFDHLSVTHLRYALDAGT